MILVLYNIVTEIIPYVLTLDLSFIKMFTTINYYNTNGSQSSTILEFEEYHKLELII